MKVRVNGEDRILSTPGSITQLLQELGLDPRLLALEYNGEILSRQHWAETMVQAGDRFEIVTMVGGG